MEEHFYSFQKKKITEFGIENFRVFKDYSNFKLKPFTILTGPNNSGKSSLNKALLLLRDNEKEINAEVSVEFLNYFKGQSEHYLGNHNLVINDKNRNTKFYFTFFQNYQFYKEISPNGRILNDYGISLNGKNVLYQSGGHIKFHFRRLANFLDKMLNSSIEVLDKTKIKNLISKLKEFSNTNIHSADINLEYYNWIDNLNEKELKDLTEQTKELYKKGIYSNLLDLNNFDLDCSKLNIKDCEYLGDDILDLDWHISLIYVFYKITDIELTEREIKTLIPFSQRTNNYTEKNKMFHLNNIIYVPTIKEQIKRSYTILDNSIIKNIIVNETLMNLDNSLNQQPQYKNKISNKNNDKNTFINLNKFIEKWIKEFEIGNNLKYGYDTETDTFFIKIDDKALPDYGFGYSQILYLIFALHNEVNNDRNIDDDDNSFYYFPRTYIVEEPETSLHPSFQSKIVEMFVDAHNTFGVNFIIETHSEYFIRKLQLLTAQKKIKTKDTVIYYFHKPNKVPKDEKQIKEIEIDKYGGLSDNFGKGFIDEAINLNFDLIKINKIHYN